MATFEVLTNSNVIGGGGSGTGYLSYVALFRQDVNATTDPELLVKQNTLGGAVAWTRNGVGDYRGTKTASFIDDLTWFAPFGLFNGSGSVYLPLSDQATIIGYWTMFQGNEDYIGLLTVDESFVATDLFTLIGGTWLCLPEIRVYQP
jgi:hypothetical protein